MSSVLPGEEGRPATRRLPRPQRREAILDGATRAFSRAGFSATSMVELAVASGITQLIVYRHFASKEDLYRAVLERGASRLAAELSGGSDRRDFGLGVVSVLAAARRHPDAFLLLWRHALREPAFASDPEKLREQLVEVVAASLEGRVPAATIPWAARAVVGFVVEAVLNWLEFGEPTRDDLFVAATNAAMRAGVQVWSTGATQ
jgi:AcrR family transcriptional regulator